MNPIYYILIGVIVLVVAIDFYIKNKNKKSDSTDVDFPKKKEKSSNVLIISICSLLVVLIIGFFVVDKNIFEGELTNSDDGISLIDNIIYQKLSMEDLIEQDSMWLTKNDMSPVSCIVREKGENIGLIIDGLKEGLWQERYENGQLNHRRTYTKGSIDMKVAEAWWENGQLQEKIFKGIHPLYKPSVKSDILPEYLMIIWNENGSLSYVCPLLFQNGKYLNHGVVIDYYDNGQKERETTYINDIRTYPIKYLNKNGEITAEINNNGYGKEWHENGQLNIEAFYNKEGRYIGLYKEWNENGKIIKDGEYVNGKFISKRKPKRKRPSKMDSKMTKANYIDFFNQQFKNLLRFFPHDDDLDAKHDLKIEIKEINNSYNLMIEQTEKYVDYYEGVNFLKMTTKIPLSKIKSIKYDLTNRYYELWMNGESIVYNSSNNLEESNKITKTRYQPDFIKGSIEIACGLGISLDEKQVLRSYQFVNIIKYFLNDYYSLKFDWDVPDDHLPGASFEYSLWKRYNNVK